MRGPGGGRRLGDGLFLIAQSGQKVDAPPPGTQLMRLPAWAEAMPGRGHAAGLSHPPASPGRRHGVRREARHDRRTGGTAAIVVPADVPPLLPCGACRQPLPVSGPDAWGLTAQVSSRAVSRRMAEEGPFFDLPPEAKPCKSHDGGRGMAPCRGEKGGCHARCS